MDFQQNNTYTHEHITIESHLPKLGKEQITRSILDGLQDNPKHISSMFFYDARGSLLFEDITLLKEYYPTRTEIELIKQAAQEIAPTLIETNIVELGSGDCSKISLLLEAIPPHLIDSIHYTPVDISLSAIENSTHCLLRRFPGIAIHGIAADFIHQLHLIPKKDRHLYCFFGSTLGNLSRKDARQFFLDLGRSMHQGDTFLLGVDMVKDISTLESAYNDSQKVTAEFNLNILNVVNDLIGTDFDTALFKHLAFYNAVHSRIEMHLVARQDMEISCPHINRAIYIKKGERIHTENSHKFTDEHIKDLAGSAGLKILKTYTDNNNWFSLISMAKT